MKCEKTAKLISCLEHFCEKKNYFLQKYVTPFLLLALRILIALVFLKSGLTKVANMDSAVFLFENEYNVPFVNPVFAAYSAAFFELTCSALLIAGLATRLATLPLIVMTLVIQFAVFQNPMHFYWLAILVTIFTFGAGFISLDCLVKRWASKCGQKN